VQRYKDVYCSISGLCPSSSAETTTQSFRNWICLRPQVERLWVTWAAVSITMNC